MKGLVLSLLLFNLNSTKAQTFDYFFGVDSNEIHYKYWLLKNYYSFDSIIKYHSIKRRDELKAFEDSLAINVYLDEKNNLKVEVNNELMVSIKKLKHKLIVNERGLIHEFTFNKKIKTIKLIYHDRLTKVRFRNGKILQLSKGYELEKKYVDKEFLNRMEIKFNYYFIETKV